MAEAASASPAPAAGETTAGPAVQGGPPMDPNKKPPSLLQKYNPVNMVRERIARKGILEERRLLAREETMKQDLERYLMEIEERRSWMAYELRIRNYGRLVKEAKVESIQKAEQAKDAAAKVEAELETGLKFYRQTIKGYRRWQSSAAKHLDLTGHTAPIFTCKLSKCQKYILSCSGDNTARLWKASNGMCLKTFYGHSKRLLGGDIHPEYAEEMKSPGIVTCSGDGTIRLWTMTGDRAATVRFQLQALSLSHSDLLCLKTNEMRVILCR
jgi:hypothetical protein